MEITRVKVKKDICIHFIMPDDLFGIDRLYTLINNVYKKSEYGLWNKDYQRIDRDSLVRSIHNGEIIVASINDFIVGCIQLRSLDKDYGHFGMLAVDERYRHYGIGRLLIQKVEQIHIERKHSRIKFELLVPQHFVHPEKILLHQWYISMDYQQVHICDFESVANDLKKYLSVECVFHVYEKNIFLYLEN